MNLEIRKKCNEALNIVKETILLIIRNIWSILVFVLLYAAFNLPACDIAINFFSFIAIRFLKVDYISPDNLMWVITRPSTIVIGLLLLVCFSFIAIFEIAGLMQAFSLSRAKKKASFLGLVTAAVSACEKCLNPKNWFLVIFIIVIFPLTGFITFSSATYGLVIPEFVMDFLLANKLYKTLLYIGYFLFLAIEVTFIFALNFFVLGENNFIKACKESKKLIEGHYIETILTVIFTSIAVFFISTSLSAVFSDILVKISKAGAITGAQKLADFIVLSKNFFNAVFAPIFNVAAITALFFKYLKSSKSISKVSDKAFKNDPFKYRKILAVVIVILLYTFVGAFINKDVIEGINEEIEIPHVVAHRGDSVRAPENTMPAIELAALERNTYIEFDVHITKDGKILVSHDDNLLRVTGKDVNMHEITFDEAMDLDTGAWFGKEYAGTKFALFDDVMKFLKTTDMNVQVEIKPSGYMDSELEHAVVDIIKNNGMENRTMITCLKLAPLLQIEEFAPEIKTVYSMFLAWGNVAKIDKIDGFTIEEENICPTLVDAIHKTNRPCFVWTVNTEERVQYFVDCNIDGILTDDPIMMRNALIACNYNSGIGRILRICIAAMMKGV